MPSPIENIIFEGHNIYLKRDDLIDKDFSGNKARKFQYYLDHDFKDVKKVLSYGSSQSNAMYSLSVLAKIKGWEFYYKVDHLSSYLKDNPHGNYALSIANGMNITIENTLFEQMMNDIDALYIQEGGRQDQAHYGIQILAQEIMEWQREKDIKDFNIFLPAGTGTTALFLQKAFFDMDISIAHRPTVYTTPCVGDSHYLQKQFLELELDEKYHPTILSIEKKHHFGKLYRENYEIWIKLRQETGVEFDLLYDPLGWRVLLSHPELLEKPMLYIHQGGILGNESMLLRYERKYEALSRNIKKGKK